MITELPWEVHSDLSEERLKFIGSWITQGRNDAVDRHDPLIGGNSWTLGTCAYAYGKFRIEQAFESGHFPWLSIIDSSNHFIFAIGAVPVRFYKGLPDEPTARTLVQRNNELKQLSLMLLDGKGRGDLAYRFAVNTDIDGLVSSITFVGLLGNSIECYWEVPTSLTPTPLYAIDTKPVEGVVLPPPKVFVTSRKAKDGTVDS